MRTFGRVETSIWQNWKFHQLSDDEKWLWIYLISCPHGNALGCFILPEGYVASDLRWSFERASEALSKLQQRHRIERDEQTGLTRVVGWFGHNRIENGNVAKGIVSTIGTLPKSGVLAHAINSLLEDGGHFVEPLRADFERALKELSQSFEPPEPEPEPEPEPNDSSATADVSANADLSDPEDDTDAVVHVNGTTRAPVTEAINVWNEICGTALPCVQRVTAKRRKKLARRMLDDFDGELSRWTELCWRIRRTPFLCGENKTGWTAKFDWVIESSDNVAKILEGNYDDRPKPQLSLAERLASEHKQRRFG